MIRDIIKTWTTQRQMNTFVTLLSNYVNLDMVEYAKGKKSLTFINSKNYEETLLKKVAFLIPKFTYKEWIEILNVEGRYKKESTKKEEDVQINLMKFLKINYKEIYRLFNMELYEEFQTRPKEDIIELILGQSVTLNGQLQNIILFYYKDNSRMCYCPETGNRVVVENVEIEKDSVIVTLHHPPQKKFTKWKENIMNMFFAE